MSKEELCGTWQLVSCVGRSEKRKEFLPYGSNPKGQLIYTLDGKMSVILMNSERALFASHDLSRATLEEKALAFDSFDAYSGSYTLDRNIATYIS